MNPVGKAVWCIESRLSGELSLAEIAAFAGVSPFHLVHAFGAATGRSVMRYVRARRLTEAARQLAAGASDILAVALDAGYGSHEAFTRAFRDQFGRTPEMLRAQSHLENIELVEAITVDSSLIVKLEEPRFENGNTLLIAGIGARYTFETNQGIPFQWQRFKPYIGNIPGQVGYTTYGVCCNGDTAGSFEYIAGVEVSDFSDIPPSWPACAFPSSVMRCSPIVIMFGQCAARFTPFGTSGCPRPVTKSPMPRTSSATVRNSTRRRASAQSKSGCR